MGLAWKVMIPLALANMLVTAVVVQVARSFPETVAPAVRTGALVIWVVVAAAAVIALLYSRARGWTGKPAGYAT
jgi:hypothetical protein